MTPAGEQLTVCYQLGSGGRPSEFKSAMGSQILLVRYQRVHGGNGFHPESLPHLYAAGFRNFETFSYDLEVPYTPGAWRGRIRASAGVGASLEPTGVQAFDAALAALLEAFFPGDLLQVTHRVFAVLAWATK